MLKGFLLLICVIGLVSISQGGVVQRDAEAKEPRRRRESSSAAGIELSEFFRRLPHFEQMRQDYRENPESLNQYLEQIAATNPFFFDVIIDRKEEFLRLLEGDSHQS